MSINQTEALALWLFVVLWYATQPVGVNSGGFGERRGDAQFVAAVQRLPVPPLVYGIVWFILYGLIAFAMFGYWQQSVAGTIEFTTTMILFIVNWLLNKSWTPVFFGAQSPAGGFVIILLCFITAVVIECLVVAELGFTWIAVFLLIYLVWLFFAMILNAIVWIWYANAVKRT
jgi:translocator protein